MFPAIALLCLAMVLALLAGPVVDYAAATARQLVDPGDYIDAVLGDGAAGSIPTAGSAGVTPIAGSSGSGSPPRAHAGGGR
jgi:multicomponent K+:H+ antiporter subunit D